MPLIGCGTTRSSDTARTATEQLLISDAIDRAVQTMNLQPLTGQTVFLDDSKLGDAVDRNYFISTLRQQLLANGCQLRDKREEADFVVEARVGAIGTDRNDQLFGLPSMNVPQIPVVQPIPAVIPEIPIAKRKDQRGIAKIAVFAYHRATGAPVWQSGIVRQESTANDVWIMGAGPFQNGTIYDENGMAKEKDGKTKVANYDPTKDLWRSNTFASPQKFATPPAATVAQATSAAEATPAATPPVATTPPPATPPAANPATPPAAAVATEPPPTAADQQVAQPASAPSPAPAKTAATAAPAPAGLTAGIEPKPAAASIYGSNVDVSALPQPRFNSPR
jgi:hypothetical protein